MKIKVLLCSLIFLCGCVPTLHFTKNDSVYSEAPEKKISHNRMMFNEFLVDLKGILNTNKKSPKVFISYAWESVRTAEGKEENRKLQERLICLQKDLESIGIDVFLDIKYLQGEMRENIRENLEASDFVILIGTPRLNLRATRDRLFVLPYFDLRLIPKDGNVVALVESPDFYAVYYLEEGKLKEIITLQLDLKDIPWMDKTNGQNGIKEAYISHKTNEMLENLFRRIKSRQFNTVSNIQYELGISIDKVHKNPKTLIPLIFKGDYDSSFPTIIQNNLIRDIRNEDNYYTQMSTLTNPLGIIAAICPQLIKDYRYVELVNKFEKNVRRNK